MSEKWVNRWKWMIKVFGAGVLAIVGAVGGWVLAEHSAYGQLQTEIKATLAAQGAVVADVKAEQQRRADKIETIGVIVEKVERIEKQSAENGKSLLELNTRAARMETDLAWLRKKSDKQ